MPPSPLAATAVWTVVSVNQKGFTGMGRVYLFLAVALMIPASVVEAQEARADKEADAVRQVVETYLYAEEGEERKRTLFTQATILSIGPSGEVIVTPISKSARRHKGAKFTSRQKIVHIDVTEGGASVKVETDLSTESFKAPKHTHYLSLLKVKGEWKIVGILMPPVRLAEGADK